MKIGKAFLWGLPAVVIVGLVKWLGDMLFVTWRPVVGLLSANILLQWGLGLILSLALIIAVGYVARGTIPLQKIWQQVFFKIFGKKLWPVVLVEWGGNWFFSLLLENNGEEYKVVIFSAPLPISGQLMIVEKERVRSTNLTTGDLFNQITSFGLRPILQKLNRTEKHSRK